MILSFEATEGKLTRVSLPSVATKGRCRPANGADAGCTFELRSYLAEIGQAALFVGVCDYGEKAAGAGPKTLPRYALDNTNTHMMRETPIALGVYPGLEFEAENSVAHFYAHICVVSSPLYQMLVVSPVGSPYPDTVQFLYSLLPIAHSS